jgi:hypothetical protein
VQPEGLDESIKHRKPQLRETSTKSDKNLKGIYERATLLITEVARYCDE